MSEGIFKASLGPVKYQHKWFFHTKRQEHVHWYQGKNLKGDTFFGHKIGEMLAKMKDKCNSVEWKCITYLAEEPDFKHLRSFELRNNLITVPDVKNVGKQEK